MIREINENYYRMPFDEVQWAVDIANQYVGSMKSLDAFTDYMMTHIRDDADDEGYRNKLDNYEDDIIEVLEDMWYNAHPNKEDKESEKFYGTLITHGVVNTGEDIEFQTEFYDTTFIIKNNDLIKFDNVVEKMDDEIEKAIISIYNKYGINTIRPIFVQTFYKDGTKGKFSRIADNDYDEKEHIM